MPELRIDPVSGLRVIVAAERSERPGARSPVAERPPVDAERDPFREGHEDRTPPEVWALRPGGGEPDTPGWTVRAVPNLYPALEEQIRIRATEAATRWCRAAAIPTCSSRTPPTAPTRWW